MKAIRHRILIMGDAFVDVTVPIARVVKDGATQANIVVSCGGTANVARWLARYDQKVGFIGKVGLDLFGDYFKNELKTEGVEAFISTDKVLPTGICVCLVAGDGSRSMVTNRGANDNFIVSDFTENVNKVLDGTQILYCSGYSLIAENNRKVIKKLLGTSAHTVRERWYNPGSPNIITEEHFRMIRGHFDGVILSLEEAQILSSKLDPSEIVKELNKHFRWVVVTMGADGCIADDEGKLVHIPSEDVECVVDTTGAGDAFAAGYLLGRDIGYNVKECCTIANSIASKAIRRFGPL